MIGGVKKMTTTSQTAYPGDLTEAQAELLLPPRRVDILSVINAMFYV